MIHESAYLICEPIVGQPKRFAESIAPSNTNGFKIAYRPIIFKLKDGEEYCPEFEMFVKACYLRGNMTMVIDEAHQICNAHSIPEMLLNACRLGRHRQLNIVYITQSFSAVSRALTENTDEFYFWKIIEPKDLDGIRSRCGGEVAAKVQNLRRLDRDAQGNLVSVGQFLHWTAYQGVVEVTT